MLPWMISLIQPEGNNDFEVLFKHNNRAVSPDIYVQYKSY